MQWTRLLAGRSSRGFSLLETIVAVAVLAVGVIALIELFSGSLRTVARTDEYSRALVYARSLMDEAYTKKSPDEISGRFDLGGGFAAVRSAGLLTKDGGVSTYEITVSVEWEPRGALRIRGLRTFHEKEE